jgi:hypothetical protein
MSLFVLCTLNDSMKQLEEYFASDEELSEQDH